MTRANCSERSMMMNALAIKYLPSDDLRRIVPNANGFGYPAQATANFGSPVSPMMPTPATPATPMAQANSTAAHHTPTNLSMSSYRYMEKYGLLSS